MQCEFCGGACRPVYAVWLGTARSTMHVCEQCESSQSDPLFSDEAVLQVYKTSYFRVSEEEKRKAQVLATDYWQKVNHYQDVWQGRALEIGAGYGYFAELFGLATPVSVDIVEPSLACQDVIRQRMPDRQVFDTVDDLPSSRTYQHIFCFHVVEHLQRFRPFLEQVVQLMEPGSSLWILTPNASAVSYIRQRKHWGWAAPDEHYQFLSQRIPDEYFSGLNLERSQVLDVRPAAYHYPSYLLTRLNQLSRQILSRWPSATGQTRFFLRSAHRLVRMTRKLFNPEYPLNVSTAERIWADVSTRRPHDELLMQLKKKE